MGAAAPGGGAQENHNNLRPHIEVGHSQKTPARTSGSAEGAAKLLLPALQKHKAPQARGGFPTVSLSFLSPRVTFLCNSSLETITLPRSPDAHRHTEQMRRQSRETGRLQSDTSQVWLCGYVPLSLPPPPPLRAV